MHMHASVSRMGDIQVRAVPRELIEAAKERAEEKDLSLSGYIRGLIQEDVERHSRAGEMEQILQQIAAAPPLVGTEPSSDLVVDTLRELRDERSQEIAERSTGGRP